MLLNEYWDESYWPACGRLRECTRVGYASAWRRHIRPELGDMDLADLTGPRIQSWLDSITSAGAARKAWAVLRQMLRSAVRLGLLDADVTGRVTPPKPSGYEPEVLDIRQIRQLLQGFHGHELEAWLICSVCLGLRTEEALGLEWQDLNLNTGKVRVQRGLQWVDGHEVIVDPKTELSRRTIVLPRFAVLRLREIRPRDGGRLIGSLNPGQVARRYATWCRSQNLPTCHAGTCATVGPARVRSRRGRGSRKPRTRPLQHRYHRPLLPAAGQRGAARSTTHMGARPHTLIGIR